MTATAHVLHGTRSAPAAGPVLLTAPTPKFCYSPLALHRVMTRFTTSLTSDLLQRDLNTGTLRHQQLSFPFLFSSSLYFLLFPFISFSLLSFSFLLLSFLFLLFSFPLFPFLSIPFSFLSSPLISFLFFSFLSSSVSLHVYWLYFNSLALNTGIV